VTEVKSFGEIKLVIFPFHRFSDFFLYIKT